MSQEVQLPRVRHGEHPQRRWDALEPVTLAMSAITVGTLALTERGPFTVTCAGLAALLIAAKIIVVVFWRPTTRLTPEGIDRRGMSAWRHIPWSAINELQITRKAFISPMVSVNDAAGSRQVALPGLSVDDAPALADGLALHRDDEQADARRYVTYYRK